VSEAGLELMIADLLVARKAGLAMATARHEGHGHPLPQLPVAHALAQLDDGAHQLMAWHMGQADVRVVAHPAVPVAPADARGQYF